MDTLKAKDPNPGLRKNVKVAQFVPLINSLRPPYKRQEAPKSLDARFKKPMTTVPDFSTVEQYDPKRLTWDRWHYNNVQNKLCYCGHGRTDWAVMPMLICVVCANSFHQACFKKPIPDEEMPMEVSWGHEFVCANCNVDVNGHSMGVEKLDLWFPGWSTLSIMGLTVAYLTGIRQGVESPQWVSLRKSKEDRECLDVESILDEYLERYHAYRSPTWINTVSASLGYVKESSVMHCSEIEEGMMGFWAYRRSIEGGWRHELVPPHVVDPVLPPRVHLRRGVSTDGKDEAARKSEVPKAVPVPDVVQKNGERKRGRPRKIPESGKRKRGRPRKRSVPSSNIATAADSTAKQRTVGHAMSNARARHGPDSTQSSSSATVSRLSHSVKSLGVEKTISKRPGRHSGLRRDQVDTDSDGEFGKSVRNGVGLFRRGGSGDGMKLFQRLQLVGGFDEETIATLWSELTETGRNLYLTQSAKLQSM